MSCKNLFNEILNRCKVSDTRTYDFKTREVIKKPDGIIYLTPKNVDIFEAEGIRNEEFANYSRLNRANSFHRSTLINNVLETILDKLDGKQDRKISIKDAEVKLLNQNDDDLKKLLKEEVQSRINQIAKSLNDHGELLTSYDFEDAVSLLSKLNENEPIQILPPAFAKMFKGGQNAKVPLLKSSESTIKIEIRSDFPRETFRSGTSKADPSFEVTIPSIPLRQQIREIKDIKDLLNFVLDIHDYYKENDLAFLSKNSKEVIKQNPRFKGSEELADLVINYLDELDGVTDGVIDSKRVREKVETTEDSVLQKPFHTYFEMKLNSDAKLLHTPGYQSDYTDFCRVFNHYFETLRESKEFGLNPKLSEMPSTKTVAGVIDQFDRSVQTRFSPEDKKRALVQINQARENLKDLKQ